MAGEVVTAGGLKLPLQRVRNNIQMRKTHIAFAVSFSHECIYIWYKVGCTLNVGGFGVGRCFRLMVVLMRVVAQYVWPNEMERFMMGLYGAG